MTISQINRTTDKLAGYILQKRLEPFFRELDLFMQEPTQGRLSEELHRIEQNYRYLLKYLEDGVVDPQRELIFLSIQQQAFHILDQVGLAAKLSLAGNHYYQKKREFISTSSLYTLKDALQNLQEAGEKIAIANLLEQPQAEVLTPLQQQLEAGSVCLFRCILFSAHFSKEDSTLVQRAFNHPSIPSAQKALLVSALLLNGMEFFDEEKLHLLLHLVHNEEGALTQRALVALILLMQQYDQRLSLYPSLQNKLAALADDADSSQNVYTILKQFILSQDTEKITRKITEELLPEMMKISPLISEKLQLGDLVDAESLEGKNPDWKNMLEEAGLQDKLQEMSELQMEGADVMHSSFSNLKGFPFFAEIAHWFVPYYAEHTAFSTMGEDEKKLLPLLEDMDYICNSDKYSLCFSIQQMPQQYRGTVLTQMLSESADFIKQQQDDKPIQQKDHSSTYSKQYIHDLYRFYKVYPYKSSFTDVFALRKPFYQTASIAALLHHPQLLLSLAEYYFSKNRYADAVVIFEQLTPQFAGHAELYQKLAYSKQMLGDIEGALQTYLKADLLLPNNSWNLRKIASCYRLLKQADEALAHYLKVAELLPDNKNIQLHIGHCYLDLKQYAEALNTYFKLEYFSSESPKVWRPIAWCSFLTQKLEQAAQYYQKILERGAQMTDHLNYGHTLWAMGKLKEAIPQYVQALEKAGNEEGFTQAFMADKEEMCRAGIKENDLTAVLDQVMYSVRSGL